MPRSGQAHVSGTSLGEFCPFQGLASLKQKPVGLTGTHPDLLLGWLCPWT